MIPSAQTILGQSGAFINLSIDGAAGYRPFNPFNARAPERRPAAGIKPAARCVRGAAPVWAAALMTIRGSFHRSQTPDATGRKTGETRRMRRGGGEGGVKRWRPERGGSSRSADKQAGSRFVGLLISQSVRRGIDGVADGCRLVTGWMLWGSVGRCGDRW